MVKRFFSRIVCLLIPCLIAACQPRIVYMPVEEGNGAENYSAESDAQDVSSDGEQTWHAVKAYCDHESIPADKTLILWYSWGTLEEAQGLEYFDLTDHTVFVDDIEVPILADGAGEHYYDESKGRYVTEYWMDMGYLEPGYHDIITVAAPRQPVFDGTDWFGPGTEYEYSEYFCSVTVEAGGEQEFTQEQDWAEKNNGAEPPAEDDEAVCNRSRYVRETIPDNTNFAPGEVFEKTWTVRNDGVCTWNSGYTLRHTQGALLGGGTSQNLPHEVTPGEEITLRLSLKAPQTPGTYTGRWEIFSDDGEVLGWYSVVIDVVEEGQGIAEDQDLCEQYQQEYRNSWDVKQFCFPGRETCSIKITGVKDKAAIRVVYDTNVRGIFEGGAICEIRDNVVECGMDNVYDREDIFLITYCISYHGCDIDCGEFDDN